VILQATPQAHVIIPVPGDAMELVPKHVKKIAPAVAQVNVQLPARMIVQVIVRGNAELHAVVHAVLTAQLPVLEAA
jgi:hypothetical protein